MISVHKVHNLLDCPGRGPLPQLGDGAPSAGQQHHLQQQSSREEHHLQAESGAVGGASIVSDSKGAAAVPSTGHQPPPYAGPSFKDTCTDISRNSILIQEAKV